MLNKKNIFLKSSFSVSDGREMEAVCVCVCSKWDSEDGHTWVSVREREPKSSGDGGIKNVH